MLDKQLEKIKERNTKEYQVEDGIDGIKLLLQENGKEELKALKALGMTESIDIIENNKGKFLERETFENDYGRVFTKDEIKELCMNYNLRFLPSKYYNGPIDPEIGAKVISFCKKNNISLNGSGYSDNFHIIAPKKYFKLKERENTMGSFKDRMMKLLSSDPLMVYEVGNGHYSFVHQWGNTFTYLRYIRAFFNRNWKNSYLTANVIITSTLILLFNYIFGIENSIGIGKMFFAAFISLITTSIFYSCACNDTEVFGNQKLYFTDEVWNDRHN